MGRLENRVVLVTGGARGIGEATVRRIVQEGASVVVGDLRDALGERLAAELGDKVAYLHLDVTAEDDWKRAIAAAVDRFGKLDGLVNNAGVFDWQPLKDTPLTNYLSVINVNQVGVFLGMKSVVPAMTAAGGGAIVNISSIAGLSGVANAMAYTASKFAVTGMTQSAAIELRALRIRVNSVHPGLVRTPLTMGTADEPGTMPPNTPGGAEPKAIADVVLFLLSDEAGYVSGAQVLANGADSDGGAGGGLNPDLPMTQ